VLSPDDEIGLEFWITNKIREIRDKGDEIKHKIGVITGDDELKLSDTNLVVAQKSSMQEIISRSSLTARRWT